MKRQWATLIAVLRTGLAPATIAALSLSEFVAHVRAHRAGRRLWRFKLAQVHRYAAQSIACPDGVEVLAREIQRAVARMIWDNFDAWKGLRESDGWFVWVGFDNGSKIEMWELPTDEQVKRNIRWYVEEKGNSLNQAVRNVMQDQFDELKMLVIGYVASAGGGAP